MGQSLQFGGCGHSLHQMQAHHLGTGGHARSSWPQAEMMQGLFQVIAVGELSS